MWDQIGGVEIQGRCFSVKTKLNFFPKENARLAVILGRNGSGKTTIARALRNIVNPGTFPEISGQLIKSDEALVKNQIVNNLFVFNEDFVDENVKINSEGLSSIVLLGTQIELEGKIEQEKEHLQQANDLIAQQENLYAIFEDFRNIESPVYIMSQIMEKLRDGSWAENVKRVRKNTIKGKVSEEIAHRVGKLSFDESEEDLQKLFDEKLSLLNHISEIPQLDKPSFSKLRLQENFEDRLLDCLKKKIQETTLTARELEILRVVQNGHQKMIEEAKKNFSEDDTTHCPYCFQAVSSAYKQELVNSIEKVLNKDVEEHRSELQAITFPNIEPIFDSYHTIAPDLVDKLNDEISRFKNIKEEYQNDISTKLNNLYNPISKNSLGLKGCVCQINGLINELEETLASIIEASSRKKKIELELLDINDKFGHYQIKSLYESYKKQEEKKSNTYSNLLKAHEDKERILGNLSNLESQKANTKIAVEQINKFLDYIFFHHGRLSIKSVGNKYYLQVDGHDVKPKDISVGERNALALCYFFIKSQSNKDIKELNKEEQLIVLDDPVSSFDFENKIGIFSFLRYQLLNVLKGNPKSKVLLLTHDVSICHDLLVVARDLKKQFSSSLHQNFEPKFYQLENCQIKQHKMEMAIPEYRTLIRNVARYAKDQNDALELGIGNMTRRVLEAFSAFIYNKKIDNFHFEPAVLKRVGPLAQYFENLMYRLFLNNESHFEDSVKGLNDDMKFFAYLSSQEKSRICKDILCLLYLLYPEHVQAYISEYEPDIRKWLEEINQKQVGVSP